MIYPVWPDRGSDPAFLVRRQCPNPFLSGINRLSEVEGSEVEGSEVEGSEVEGPTPQLHECL